MMIRIFVRHTSNSHGKCRPEWFSLENCFKNLLGILDDRSELIVLFDGDPTEHFVNKYDVKIVKIEGGCDSKSFIKVLDYVKDLDNIRDDDIIYLLEDDYLHRPGSLAALREIFSTFPNGVDYVSLYDHADKYMIQYQIPGFVTQLTHTQNIHWRTTPSTTNSYAMKFSTLKRDLDIHYKYCTMGPVTQDHLKFLELWKSGKSLLTPIPGYSTHVENALMSPTIDWFKINEHVNDKNNGRTCEDCDSTSS
jgi:hypothetical protein